MSKLSRAKLASSVSSAFGQEPPDKKRKTDNNVTADPAFDDDLDFLLTQNMNKLDQLVESTQSAAWSEETAINCSDWSHHVSSRTAEPAHKCELEGMRSFTAQQAASSANKRLIGHGSGHSRSADHLNSSLSTGSSVQMARKSSFSIEKSCTSAIKKEPDIPLTSDQGISMASCSTNFTNIAQNFHVSNTMTAGALPMRLDANANCTKTKLTQISEECEFYKAEVCMSPALVCNIFSLFYTDLPCTLYNVLVVGKVK